MKPGGGHDKASHDGPVFDVTNNASRHQNVPRDSGLGGEAGGNNDRWGDIFYADRGTGQPNSNNWTTAGQAIYNGTAAVNPRSNKQACRAMSISEYIRSEMEAVRDQPGLRDELGNPITMQTIMKELDEMGAAEDAATKEALGGSFNTWYVNNGNGSQDPSFITSKIAEKSPSVTTTPPSGVSGTAATLNGTITPFGKSMVHYFEFSEDESFPDNSTDTVVISEIPSTAQGPENVSATKTGLRSGTTYYYRTIGVITSGSAADDTLVETVLVGVTEQFNSSAASAPSISSLTCGNQKLTVAFTGSANTVDKYQYSVDGGTWTDSLQSGTTSFDISSLTNGTTYSIRVRGFAASVPGYSSVASTGTPCGPPSATTRPATSVLQTSAVLNGIATSNGASTTVKFQYKLKADGVDCANDNFATVLGEVQLLTQDQTPVELSTTAIDASNSVSLTGLTAGTTYCYRIVATNSTSVNGNGVEFTTTSSAPVPPTVTTVAATSVTTTTATINGTGTPNGVTTTAKFTYKALDGNFNVGNTAVTVIVPGSLGDGQSAVNFSYDLVGLTPGTTYYFKAIVTNAVSNGDVDGTTLSFTTPLPPEATTTAATSVTETTAILNGTIDPNNISTDVEFTWGTDPTLNTGNTVVAAIESPLSPTPNGAAVTVALTGLTGGTTYYFRVSASNVNGNSNGQILSFTTTASAPGLLSTDDPLGRVIGTAWFDMNKNNQRESDEPLLRGVPIQLTPSATASVRATRSGVRSQATPQVLNTNSDGSFDFTTVAPGSYKISGTLPGNFGIQQSWDSTGNDDWSVSVTVVARQTSRGDFAAIANLDVNAGLDPADCQTLNNSGDVALTWAGFDQTSGNSDDTAFTTKLKDDCTFQIDGVPTGKYNLAIQNPTTKKSVAVRTFSIPKNATAVSMTIAGKTVSLNVEKSNAVLPATGTQSSQLSLWALVTVFVGALFVQTSVASRRRTRRR